MSHSVGGFHDSAALMIELCYAMAIGTTPGRQRRPCGLWSVVLVSGDLHRAQCRAASSFQKPVNVGNVPLFPKGGEDVPGSARYANNQDRRDTRFACGSRSDVNETTVQTITLDEAAETDAKEHGDRHYPLRDATKFV